MVLFSMEERRCAWITLSAVIRVGKSIMLSNNEKEVEGIAVIGGFIVMIGDGV
jgi:hypothetical protein